MNSTAVETGRSERRRQLGRVCYLLAAAAGVGAAAGVLWEAVVELPGYLVHSDGGASITERGLTEIIGGDAWFCAIGLVVGSLLGLVAWRWFRSLGWALVLVVVVCAVAAALVCWFVGYGLGPGDFAPRLAAAQAGEVVPVELDLRAKVSVLVWPFFAVVPVLLGSSLGHDEEDVRPDLRSATAASR